MENIFAKTLVLAFFSAIALGCVSQSPMELRADESVKDIIVSAAVQPMVPSSMTMMAAYFTVTNDSDEAITIVGAKSSSFKIVEIHKSMQMDGMHSMHKVAAVELVAGESVKFESGSLHLMLMHPAVTFTEGDMYEMDLMLADGRVIPFSVKVIRN